MSKPKVLFIDIETSPNVLLSFRIGQKVSLNPDSIVQERRIICICWKWQGEKEVHHLEWDRKQDDKRMLKRFHKVLDKADIIVGHNGDGYDIPFIKGRMLIHGLPPVAEIQSLDTLKFTRGKFYFNSNKLDYIGQTLGLGKKLETGGFQLWKDITLNNCSKSLKKMIKYCKQDVKLLEKVYDKLLPHSKPKYRLGGDDSLDCTNCGSQNTHAHRTYATRAGTKRQVMLCQECGASHVISRSKYEKERGG